MTGKRYVVADQFFLKYAINALFTQVENIHTRFSKCKHINLGLAVCLIVLRQ